MKQKIKIIISASAAILAFSALAQATPDLQTDRPDYARDRMPNPPRIDRLNGAVNASDVIGMTVKNYQSEKLGKVADLAVDVESGRIVQVILSTGGFIGMGDTLTAVPPGALHHDVAHKVLHLDVAKENLKRAPKFETAKWEEYTQSNRVTEVYAYYGQQPYFAANRDEFEAASRDGVATASEDLNLVRALPRHMDGTINTSAKSAMERDRNIEAVHNVAVNYNAIITRNPDGSLSREYYPNANGINNSPWSSLGYVQKASKVIGTPVKNLENENLGKVENILLDLSASRIVAVIISSGRFIGKSDELSAIPPSALRFNAEHDILQLDASKEQLTSAPHFKSNKWPNMNQPSYASGVYRAYHVEPYFTTGAPNDVDNTRRNVRDRSDRAWKTTAADNTAQNIRDRNDQTLTPLHQGNSQADLTTTAQIRKEIIAGDNLSVNARNVKIITINGQITLRGPVNTAEEKTFIGEIAERSPHTGNVDNQLEVKSAANRN